MKMPVSVSTVLDASTTDRVGRYPRHMFNVQAMPYSIQPLAIAPVLPAESLTNLFFESRCITSPIRNSIIGWKKEYFAFYVKVTDLLQDAIRNMFVDPTNTDLSATLGVAANDTAYYTAKGGVPYLKLAIERIAATWFRDAGESATNVVINNYPAAQIREGFYLDSLTDKDDMPEGAALATATDAGDLDRLLLAFEQLRAMGLAKMDYEDFLRSYGISVPDKDQDRPELLFHCSDFQYPSNTVNPVDGTPSSAVSWVFRQGENRKRKFFKEPGFVIFLTVTRPKVYFSGLAGNAAAHMSRAWDWMPALLHEHPQTSLKQFPVAAGPLGDRAVDPDSYFLDMRDVLTYGDQFHNRQSFDASMAGAEGVFHAVPLPDGNLKWKYPTEASVKKFFSDTATAGRQNIYEDGYISLQIMGKQRDMTRGNIALV